MPRPRSPHLRADRVAEQIRMDVAEILQRELKDPRLGMVTCTRVKLTSDLKSAKVYVSVLGNEAETKQSMEALHGANAFVRRKLAARLEMRLSPDLEFVFDPAVEYGIQLERLLDEAKERDADIPPDPPKEEDSPDLGVDVDSESSSD